jgi:hypothetical protein
MAEKKWIQKAIKRPGAFTKKAKAAGKSVSAYASSVLKEGSKASTRTKRQAALAQTLSKMRKKKTTKKYQTAGPVDSVDMKKFQNTNPKASNYNVAGDKAMNARFIEGAQKWKKAQEQKEKEKGTLKGKIKSKLGLYKKGGTNKSKKK